METARLKECGEKQSFVLLSSEFSELLNETWKPKPLFAIPRVCGYASWDPVRAYGIIPCFCEFQNLCGSVWALLSSTVWCVLRHTVQWTALSPVQCRGRAFSFTIMNLYCSWLNCVQNFQRMIKSAMKEGFVLCPADVIKEFALVFFFHFSHIHIRRSIWKPRILYLSIQVVGSVNIC